MENSKNKINTADVTDLGIVKLNKANPNNTNILVNPKFSLHRISNTAI